MSKAQPGRTGSPTRHGAKRLAIIACVVLACTTLLQAIVFFGLAGVPLRPDAFFLILAPIAAGVATLVLARRG
jgi:hypothetical protein